MNPQIPFYISWSFLIAILFPILMIAQVAKQNVAAERAQLTFNSIVGFFLVYLLVVGWFCTNGTFTEVSLPPKIILYTTLPLLIFLTGVISNTSFYKSVLKRVRVESIIRLHIFRLIGGFFILLMLIGHLPKVFSLIAGIGDIVTAISSLWIARNLQEKTDNARLLALIWNTFGLMDILVTSFTAIALTKISMETGAQSVEILTTFPFCFIPAFAPATIIFLHISIYRKLF